MGPQPPHPGLKQKRSCCQQLRRLPEHSATKDGKLLMNPTYFIPTCTIGPTNACTPTKAFFLYSSRGQFLNTHLISLCQGHKGEF